MISQEINYTVKYKRSWSFTWMDSGRNKNCRLFKNKRPWLGIILTFRKQSIYKLFALFSHFAFSSQCNHFHGSLFSTITYYFSVDINFFVILELFYKLASFLQRLFKWVWISPGKIHRVFFWVIVVESVCPSNEKTLTILTSIPLNRSSTSSPFHTVRSYSVYRPKSHFIQLALETHISHTKSIIFVGFRALDAEIKPRFVMANRCIWQTISAHEALEVVIVVSWPVAPCQISWVELAWYLDTIFEFKQILLRMDVCVIFFEQFQIYFWIVALLIISSLNLKILSLLFSFFILYFVFTATGTFLIARLILFLHLNLK